MASLTPEDKREEVTAAAFNDGIINGAMAFVPSLAGYVNFMLCYVLPCHVDDHDDDKFIVALLFLE
jgi:hypothetical protein